MPDVCVRRWCIVTPLSTWSKSYGSKSHSLSLSDSIPASISLQMTNPVNNFVPDAIPKAVFPLFKSFSLLLRKPEHLSKITSCSSHTENTPENIPASFQSFQTFSIFKGLLSPFHNCSLSTVLVHSLFSEDVPSGRYCAFFLLRSLSHILRRITSFFIRYHCQTIIHNSWRYRSGKGRHDAGQCSYRRWKKSKTSRR